MLLITRKSVLNPGTRYYARGLNRAGEAGNEMEGELVVWRTDSTGASDWSVCGRSDPVTEEYSNYLRVWVWVRTGVATTGGGERSPCGGEPS